MTKFPHTAITLVLAVASVTACEPRLTAEARTATAGLAAGSVVVQAIVRPASQSVAPLRFVTAPDGNAARYRVREQLAGRDLPNDAVGETKGVSGVIGVDTKGKLIPGESKFTVDVATLASDRDMRDGYIRRRTLQTAQYPSVTLVPTAVRGLSFPLPASGSRTFDLVGDLTVRDVTKPTVWRVTAQFARDRVSGSASTAFTFEDFGMPQPRVPVVLSVADTIKLELDFTLVRDAGTR